MKAAITYQVLTPLPLDRQRDAQRILEMWREIAPETFPDRVGIYEPLRQRLDPLDFSIVKSLWEFHVMFKRSSKPRAESSVFMKYGPHRKHSIWSISVLDPKGNEAPCLSDLLNACAVELSPDFAFVHQLREGDLESGFGSGTITSSGAKSRLYDLFVTTHNLKVCVPDLYWKTLFGKPYVEMFTRERLLSAPAYSIREFANGSIAVQLSENLLDKNESAGVYEARKSAVKNHLGLDAFYDASHKSGHTYRAPDFEWLPTLN